jgi:hypothetical protein
MTLRPKYSPPMATDKQRAFIRMLCEDDGPFCVFPTKSGLNIQCRLFCETSLADVTICRFSIYIDGNVAPCVAIRAALRLGDGTAIVPEVTTRADGEPWKSDAFVIQCMQSLHLAMGLSMCECMEFLVRPGMEECMRCTLHALDTTCPREMCMICMEETAVEKTVCCNQGLHAKCHARLSDRRCPNCRKEDVSVW